MRYRGLLALLALVVPVVLMPPTSIAHAGSCGVWRWPVKTLSDSRKRDVNFHPHRATIDKLRHLDAPNTLSENTPRLAPVEDKTYLVKAVVREATIGDDHDVHLVIASRAHHNHTMIVEFPDPRCVASSFKRDRIRHARHQLFSNCGPISSSSFTPLRGTVGVTGVGFWDEKHGQTGIAPNGIELHPVLNFKGRCARR